MKVVMQMAEEVVHAQERDPYTAFANRVRELNYGDACYFRVTVVKYFMFHVFTKWIIPMD